MSRPYPTPHGPFRADQIRSGDPYELSNGVDTGYSPSDDVLRAPDVAVGNVPDAPGWVRGAPPLAVEYADTGQDEKDLTAKIAELFAAGTKLVWVVRLAGPRRVEVHEPGKPMRLVRPGEELTAAGILRNPLPVEALYDRDAAHRVTFRNLLQRQGYQDLDEVRTEGRDEGREEGREEGRTALRNGIVNLLEGRGLELSDANRTSLADCRELDVLQLWLTRAATAATPDEVFAPIH